MIVGPPVPERAALDRRVLCWLLLAECAHDDGDLGVLAVLDVGYSIRTLLVGGSLLLKVVRVRAIARCFEIIHFEFVDAAGLIASFPC